MVFVSDSDVKSPLVVLINDFSGPNSPFVIAEGTPKTVEVVWAATKHPFRVTVTIQSEAGMLSVSLDHEMTVVDVHRQQPAGGTE